MFPPKSYANFPPEGKCSAAPILYQVSSSVSTNNLSIWCVCVIHCVVIPFIHGRQACGRTSRGHTGFLIHRPPAALALIFLARRIQTFLSLVDREVEFLCTNELIVLEYVLGSIFFFFVRKNPRSCDCTGIQTHVPTSEGFEVTT